MAISSASSRHGWPAVGMPRRVGLRRSGSSTKSVRVARRARSRSARHRPAPFDAARDRRRARISCAVISAGSTSPNVGRAQCVGVSNALTGFSAPATFVSTPARGSRCGMPRRLPCSSRARSTDHAALSAPRCPLGNARLSCTEIAADACRARSNLTGFPNAGRERIRARARYSKPRAGELCPFRRG